MTEEEEIFEPEEPLEEEPIEVPAKPPLKRSRTTAKEDLKQRVECNDCGRQVSLHTLKYGKHRCPAKRDGGEAACPKAEEAEPVVEAPAPKKRAKKVEKPALPEKEVLKPLKNKAVIKKAARFQEEDAVQYYSDPSSVPQYTDPFQPPYAQETAWSQLLLQRQAQARMRAESIAGPYAAMFASQRSRVM